MKQKIVTAGNGVCGGRYTCKNSGTKKCRPHPKIGLFGLKNYVKCSHYYKLPKWEGW